MLLKVWSIDERIKHLVVAASLTELKDKAFEKNVCKNTDGVKVNVPGLVIEIWFSTRD